jgi:ABC-type glycerol-3-phosphate transport system substrate-binding protein
MQYRKDLLREVGYSDSEFSTWATESMTWEKFSRITAEARDAADVKYGYTFQADSYAGLSCCNFNEFMSSWGGAYFGNPEQYLFGPMGDRPVTVAERQVVRAVKMVRTFIHGSDAPNTLDGYTGNIAPSAVLQWTEETSRRPFTNGNAVMHRNWPYSINTNGAEDVFGEDLGVMPIPYAKTAEEAGYPLTGGPTAALGGWHLAVNPYSEHVDAAMEVVKAASKDRFNLALFDVLGQIPPKPSLLTSDRARDVPVMGRYLDSLKVAGTNAISRPVTAAWPQQSTKIAQQVHEALMGNETPGRAMDALETDLTRIENNV